jgi:dihydrofolate synthase/folylpolyglutamate synthase
MWALTSLLGEPQQSIPSIHITGTNGKGSTTAMATSLLMAKGLTVGTYTSPNLHAVSERLAHNGKPIDDASLTDVLTELALLEPLLPERPTRFELLTAAALSWFSSEAVDAMVVEVGLGGTWDCTNVVQGDVAVLTNVSFDHTDVLGPTLEGIATDKAGIIEPGSRVVVGERPRSGWPGVTSAASPTGSPWADGWSHCGPRAAVTRTSPCRCTERTRE